ncbi:MAG: hypothetical protein OEX03_02615 [Gammaproteobacteria bacterium]|nr:hypothetical protein [Gammaproteobacteria bacterium]
MLLIIASFLSGCMVPMKKEAFGVDKKFTTVSVYGRVDVTHIRNSGESAKFITSKLPEMLDAALSKVKLFKYTDSKSVIKKNAYKSFPYETPKWGPISFNMAPGYTYIFSDSRAADLAKRLPFDGLLAIRGEYTGDNMPGPTYTMFTKLVVIAYDKNGNKIWTGMFGGASTADLTTAEIKSKSLSQERINSLLLKSAADAVSSLAEGIATVYYATK